MVGQAVPTTIGPSDVRRYRIRLLRAHRRSGAPAAMDRLVPSRSATRPAALQRLLRDAEIVFGGEISWRSLQKMKWDDDTRASGGPSAEHTEFGVWNARRPIA